MHKKNSENKKMKVNGLVLSKVEKLVGWKPIIERTNLICCADCINSVSAEEHHPCRSQPLILAWLNYDEPIDFFFAFATANETSSSSFHWFSLFISSSSLQSPIRTTSLKIFPLFYLSIYLFIYLLLNFSFCIRLPPCSRVEWKRGIFKALKVEVAPVKHKPDQPSNGDKPV